MMRGNAKNYKKKRMRNKNIEKKNKALQDKITNLENRKLPCKQVKSRNMKVIKNLRKKNR